VSATVTMIDTSVLCEMLQVPGKSDPDRVAEVSAEMDRRSRAGERFVIPITAVIETGNHIAQAAEYRHDAAGRFVRFLRLAMSQTGPWLILETRLGTDFLSALCDGDSTGQTLENLAALKVGAGDIAILVERDQLLSTTALRDVQVWTYDRGPAAQAASRQ
jgi:hypothetical protein